MSKTLLEKAKLYRKKNQKRAISEEMVQLAIAWAMGDVSLMAVCNAIGRKSNPTYCQLAMALREAFRIGKIVKKDSEAKI